MTFLLDLYNRLFLVWVIASGAAAFWFPDLFLPLRGSMDLLFAVTMFGVGMVLDPSDFVSIFEDFRVVVIGAVAQFSIMPLSAFGVSRALALPDELALGLILTGCAPGAMASNVLSYLARADVAYSVSLTTVSTLLAPVLTPLLTLLLANTVLDVSFWALFASVSKMVLVPLVLGIALRRAAGDRVMRLARLFPAVSTTFIALICAVVIALNRAYIVHMDASILAGVLILNIGGLVLGYATGVAFRFDRLKKRALSIEIGMQNAGLGSVLALQHFGERAALPSVIFVFICIFTASILVQVWSRGQPPLAPRKKA
jgi:BASS family bile acid:Na+ symporter